VNKKSFKIFLKCGQNIIKKGGEKCMKKNSVLLSYVAEYKQKITDFHVKQQEEFCEFFGQITEEIKAKIMADDELFAIINDAVLEFAENI
jgi:hypothetical protein